MKNIAKRRVHNLYVFMREAVPIMIFVMLVFFGAAIIGFQQDNRRILRDTAAAVKNTETIVSKQDETLIAIKTLALDSKLTSKQLGDTIICMLLVPVGQRTTQTQDNCRDQAQERTPASADNGSTKAQPDPAPQASITPEVSATQTPDNDGIIVNLPGLPSIHIASPF